MKPLVLTDCGACLKARGGKLVLFSQETASQREWTPAGFPYDAVVCDPARGFVTFPALRWLAERGATLTVLNFNGKPMLTALPDYPINGRDRLAQLSSYLDPRKRLELASAIVEAKTGAPVPVHIRSMNHLLMWEAQQAEIYWRGLGITRDYPHARDPRNLAINYCFGLLESVARRAIHRLGLEPSVGFLHKPRASFEGKSAFVYDVMEPFRSSAVLAAVAKPLRRRDYFPVFGHGLRLRGDAPQALAEKFSCWVRERDVVEWLTRFSLRFHLPSTQDPPSPRPSRRALPGGGA